MENKITYNAKYFYSIELKDAERDPWIEYKPAKRNMFFILKPEHYKCDYMSSSRWKIDEHEDTHFIGEDHNVFHKPRVLTTIKMNSGEITCYNYFNNIKEASVYYNNMIANLKKERIKFIELKGLL